MMLKTLVLFRYLKLLVETNSANIYYGHERNLLWLVYGNLFLVVTIFSNKAPLLLSFMMIIMIS